MYVRREGQKINRIKFTAAVVAAAVFLMSVTGEQTVGAKESKPAKEIFDVSTGLSFIQNKNTLTVNADEKEIFTTDEEIDVQDFLLGDVDRDGDRELLILCKKRGRFGEHRPFWVEGDDSEISQHIFIYECDSESITPKWMASDIGLTVSDWFYDGNTLTLTDTDGNDSYWKWQSWGLEKADDVISILAVGDNIIHTPIMNYAAKNDMNFDFAYERVAPYIRKPDVALFVSETPLVDRKSAYGDYPTFGTPCEIAASLSRAGFDIAACATNHIPDRGSYGLECTLEEYKKNYILPVGIDDGGYIVKSIKGVRIAFMDYTAVLNSVRTLKECRDRINCLEEEQAVRKKIREAKDESDFLIMIVHWGTEYSDEPDEEQKKWTKVFLSEGVDVCLGSHPHVRQTMERLSMDNHEMIVFYSLGNFFSAQNIEGTDEGTAVYLAISRNDEKIDVINCREYTMRTIHEKGEYYVVLEQ